MERRRDAGALFTELIRSEMTGTKRNGNGERRALAQFAFGANGPAMQLHKLLHQSQPYAGAFERAAPLAFNPVETFEQPRQFGCGTPTPVSRIVSSAQR